MWRGLIIAARSARRRELREQLSAREATVKLFLEVHQPPPEPPPPPPETPPAPRLKRYYNE